MLEKPEGEIKNRQSWETGNIRYTRHRTKTNKTNTTQHGPLRTPGVHPGARDR